MGKGGGGSQPAAPDPAETAKAQTATNKETAYWNAVLNNVNQITPYGTLKYTQTGGGPQYNMDAYNQALSSYNQRAIANANGTQPKFGVRDGYVIENATGKVVSYNESQPQVFADNLNRQYGSVGSSTGTSPGTLPKLEDFKVGESPPSFTSTIELTPEQKAILDRTTANQKALVDLGGEQLGRIRGAISSPFSFGGLESPEVAQGQFEDALYSRLNPQFDRDEEALRSRLINQGIGQGSEAYNTEMERFNQAKNDARMQAVIGGQDYALQRRNQAINEYTTQRNAPLNEYIGLTSGVQVQNPSFQSSNYNGMQPVDTAGLINQNYQNQMNAYNSRVAQNNSTMGGLFSLGGSLLGAAGSAGGFGSLFSDRAVKQNIIRLGKENGHQLYEFSYTYDPDRRYIGVIAQDVEEYMPEAVKEVDGIKTVDYSMLGIEMREVE